MHLFNLNLESYEIILGITLIVVALSFKRLSLSLAKHPSLAGHSKMSRKVSKLVPFYEFKEDEFFSSDHAPAQVMAARQKGFEALSDHFNKYFKKTYEMASEARDSISDMQFTKTYRVPFQYSNYVNEHLKYGNFVKSSSGVTLTDMDDNIMYDLGGSYGVNVFGNDFYKTCIEKGSALVKELGPVLGPYHPLIIDNVNRIKEISGMDEVSFHMSGTEAVMQAVRLARYHTKRTHLVRFCGAYHGWWGDVQPGIGNPTPADYTYTLKEMDGDTLRVLRTRHDIACVLVNPLQALHPNKNAPTDSSLVDSSRTAKFQREAYTKWLNELRQVCTEKGIVLIFDEIFVGFRIALGGAQEYFNVHADMVTYGKTLAGGLPIGVLCGKKNLMQRYNLNRPTDICFARGTFNSHPYVMATMHEFLESLNEPTIQNIYQNLDETWDRRAKYLNERFDQEKLPLKVSNFSSIWLLEYTTPSRYNWLVQFYLLRENISLGWIGTGRFIFSLNYTEEDFEQAADRIIKAAHQMKDDHWWWCHHGTTNKSIQREILKEMLKHFLKSKLNFN